VTGLGPESIAAANPVRDPGGARTGPAGSLLPVRRGATAARLGPGERAVGARPGLGQLGGHDLVHHRHVGLDAEHGGIELHRALLVAVGIAPGHGEALDDAHDAWPACSVCRPPRPPFTAWRISTSPPRGPG